MCLSVEIPSNLNRIRLAGPNPLGYPSAPRGRPSFDAALAIGQLGSPHGASKDAPPLARCLALAVVGWLSTLPALADEPTPNQRPASPKAEAVPAQPSAIAPATRADAARERLATDARLEDKEKPAPKPIRDLLEARKALLLEWEKINKERAEVENPEHSPEREAAAFKSDLDKARALLEQATRTPDALLPEAFLAKDAGVKVNETRLGEMKEAIDEARKELKDRSAELETLRAEGSSKLAAKVAELRAERDKVYQGVAALVAGQGERQAGAASATSPEARELFKERLVNFEWETRVEAERLACMEAKIAQATRRLDLGTVQIAAKAARVQLARRLLERMEARYTAQAERQRSDLKQAVAKEETRAANSGDPVERRRAKRAAEMFELESQVVAYEKAYATTTGASIQEMTALADAANLNFADLKKLLDDGNVSPLDALRLKNDFRRITPERAQIVRTDLAETASELTTYENALTDAEIDLVNDSRDDRFDRESLLEQVPTARRAEANAMLEELETRHKALLNRRRNVLQKLARRAEDAHNQVLRRLQTLDEQYAFIRTHIFWIRDAEPVGPATVAHARDDSIRAAKALVHLALETSDRSLWGRVTPDFALALSALVILPWPLHLVRKRVARPL